MVLFEGLLWVGFVCLLVPVLAEYGKIKKIAAKAFNWIAGGGLSFILATTFTLSFWTYAPKIAELLGQLFEFIGWVLVLVGSLWAIMELLQK